MAKAKKKSSTKISKPDKAKARSKSSRAPRSNSLDALKQLISAAGKIECWMSDHFAERGQVQIFVYKQSPSLSGFVCFLIDRGVVGLKDCWGQTRIDHATFKNIVQSCELQGVVMRRATLKEVRPLVAGGARWAHDHSMRLPAEWEESAAILGNMDDWKSADTSIFVKEFSGHPEDLRQRLVDSSFDEYVRRTDVQFEFDDRAPYKDQETGEYVDNDADDFDLDELGDDELESMAADLPIEELNQIADLIAPAARELVAESTTWHAETGVRTSPELYDGWLSVLIATMLSSTILPAAPPEEVKRLGYRLLDDLSRRIEKPKLLEYNRAVEQALQHIDEDATLASRALIRHAKSIKR